LLYLEGHFTELANNSLIRRDIKYFLAKKYARCGQQSLIRHSLEETLLHNDNPHAAQG
jgi:hypothetical protein